MSQVVTAKFNNFIAGKVSQQWLQRDDLEQSQTLVLRDCKNGYALDDGSFKRRCGFVPNLEIDFGDAILVRFNRSKEDGFVFVFGDDNRIYGYHSRTGFVKTSTGAIYSIASPYQFQDLRNDRGEVILGYTQVSDTVFFAHYKYPTQVLRRIENNQWTLRAANFVGGPFDIYNQDKNIRVVFYGANRNAGQSIQLRSNVDAFEASDVGRLFILDSTNYLYPVWMANSDVFNTTNNRFCIANNSIYELINMNNNTSSGLTAPFVTNGVCNDGRFTWRYVHSGYGIARITAFTSTTEVSAILETNISDDLAQTGTTIDWGVNGRSTNQFAKGLYKQDNIYPHIVTMFHNRLYWGISLRIGNFLCGSRYDLFEDFSAETAGQVLATDSIKISLNDTNSFDEITSISNKDDVLLVTTRSGVYMVRADAPTSGGVAKDLIALEGGGYCEIMKNGALQSYVSAENTKINKVGFTYTTQTYSVKDLTQYGTDVVASGIRGIEKVWMGESFIVGYLNDGNWFVWQYDEDAGLDGFFPCEITKGVVRSMTINNVGFEDIQDIVMAVKTTVGDEERCFIGYIPTNDVEFLEWKVQLESPVLPEPVNEFTVPSKIFAKNEIVQIANPAGGYLGEATVSDEYKITLPERVEADVIIVGKPLETVLVTEPINYTKAWGSVTAIKQVFAQCVDAPSFEYSSNFIQGGRWYEWTAKEARSSLFTHWAGTVKLDLAGGLSTQGFLTDGQYIKNGDTGIQIRVNKPYPFHLSGIGQVLQVSGG